MDLFTLFSMKKPTVNGPVCLQLPNYLKPNQTGLPILSWRKLFTVTALLEPVGSVIIRNYKLINASIDFNFELSEF